jgi:hypothetical protein
VEDDAEGESDNTDSEEKGKALLYHRCSWDYLVSFIHAHTVFL